jgi:DNA-binding CsgD family transcriptional regulator
MSKGLSPREEEMIELCVQGLTNDAIALKLGLSVGTVNTYWLRIRLKVGGSGRTDTVVRVIKDRAERALRESNVELADLTAMLITKDRDLVELRAALALLHLALEQIKSTVWATDKDLMIDIISNGEYPSSHFGVSWEVGKTVQEIFKTDDPEHPAIAAHLLALQGEETVQRLTGEFRNLSLHVLPLTDEGNTVIGCVSILNTITGE